MNISNKTFWRADKNEEETIGNCKRHILPEDSKFCPVNSREHIDEEKESSLESEA